MPDIVYPQPGPDDEFEAERATDVLLSVLKAGAARYFYSLLATAIARALLLLSLYFLLSWATTYLTDWQMFTRRTGTTSELLGQLTNSLRMGTPTRLILMAGAVTYLVSETYLLARGKWLARRYGVAP